MKKFIISQIELQENPENFSFALINSLSWMVGSLCGAILEKEEKSFFITSLRTLLHLCENKKGKPNKAVIASCIMYVVGQYPTFLKNNWTFERTVIRKLFEFMKEEHEGIMEMACGSFLKIVKSTADQFVIRQNNDEEPYVVEIIRRIPEETEKLSSDTLKLKFYEALGYLIGAEKNSEAQLELIRQSLGLNLMEFENIIKMAESNPGILQQE
jgi:exportin-1